MDIITRSEWGARAPDPRPFPTTSWSSRTGFVVHYSAADDDQSVRSIQNYQMDHNGWRDVGYNFLVDKYGRVYEGAHGTWYAIGAHVANHNTANIGVCAIGTDAQITEAQMRSIRALYDECCRRAGKALAKRYHSGMSGASTSCPGDRLRAWVRSGMPVTQPSTQEDDMTPQESDKLSDTHHATTQCFSPVDGTRIPLQVWTQQVNGEIDKLNDKLDRILTAVEAQ
jgi:hypothetical protein